MMKHIKRKTVMHMSLSEENINNSSPKKTSVNLLDTIKYREVKDKHAILFMDNGERLYSFFYNNNGDARIIPLANPILIYFNLAQVYLKDIYASRKLLLGTFNSPMKVKEDSLTLFYQYFGLTSSFAVMLMTAIEAFVNQSIQENYKYQKSEKDKCLKIYDFDQIQRWIPLNEKIEEILNKTSGKNFKTKQPLAQKHIDNLNELRNLIVHTKAGDNFKRYADLFKRTLNFEFNDSIEAVKDFINYYEPNLIEPCLCGRDT